MLVECFQVLFNWAELHYLDLQFSCFSYRITLHTPCTFIHCSTYVKEGVRVINGYINQNIFTPMLWTCGAWSKILGWVPIVYWPVTILIPWMYQIMFKNSFPVLLIGITCTVTLSTINTVQFKPLILWVNAGYGTGVKIRTPQLRLRVINRALYFTNGKGTWGGGAYYLWGAG